MERFKPRMKSLNPCCNGIYLIIGYLYDQIIIEKKS